MRLLLVERPILERALCAEEGAEGDLTRMLMAEPLARLYRGGWRLGIVGSLSIAQAGAMASLNAEHGRFEQQLARLGAELMGVFLDPYGSPRPTGVDAVLETLVSRLALRPGYNALLSDDAGVLHIAEMRGFQAHLLLTAAGQQAYQQPGLPADAMTHADLAHFADALLAHALT